MNTRTTYSGSVTVTRLIPWYELWAARLGMFLLFLLMTTAIAWLWVDMMPAKHAPSAVICPSGEVVPIPNAADFEKGQHTSMGVML